MARTATTADVFNAIAEAQGRDILDSLRAGEQSVGTLVERLGLSQPRVSKHLTVLRQVGLVHARSAGRQRLHQLHRPTLAHVRRDTGRYGSDGAPSMQDEEEEEESSWYCTGTMSVEGGVVLGGNSRSVSASNKGGNRIAHPTPQKSSPLPAGGSPGVADVGSAGDSGCGNGLDGCRNRLQRERTTEHLPRHGHNPGVSR